VQLRLVVFGLLALLFALPLPAQDFQSRPLERLIDAPVPGGPASGGYEFALKLSPDGGALAAFDVGIFERFAIGLSYGGDGVIGYQKPDWNPAPGVRASLRLLNESIFIPALAIGYDSQGQGAWNDSLARYRFKAKGLYAALAKNFAMGSLGEISWIGGVNRNPQEEGPKRLDAFAGFDYRLFATLALLGEFTGALDDRNDPRSLGLSRGYLNAAARWLIGRQLAVDLIFRDILLNQPTAARGGAGIGREVRIVYAERLFGS